MLTIQWPKNLFVASADKQLISNV